MPSTDASKIFTCVYAVIGVACLGVALGILGSNMIESRQKAAQQAEDLNKFQIMSLFDSSMYIPSLASSANSESISLVQNNWKSGPIFRVATPALLLTSLGFSIGYLSGWSVLSTIYYMVVTGKSKESFSSSSIF